MKDFNKHTFISPPVAPNRPSNTKGVLAVIGFWGLTAAVVVATVTTFNYVQTNHNSGLAFAVFAVLVAVSYKPYKAIAEIFYKLAQAPKSK